jgi:hypothetical protein
LTEIAASSLAADGLAVVARDPNATAALYQAIGEYCHVVRNRLHCLRIGLYLERMEAPPEQEPEWHHLEQRYFEVEQFIHQLQTLLRPLEVEPVHASLDALLAQLSPRWTGVLNARGIQMHCSPPNKEAWGMFDSQRLAESFDALAAWRAEQCAHGATVRVTWNDDGSFLHVSWHEIAVGSEIATPSCERAQSPVSLVLPTVVKVMAAHGGDVHFDASRGWRVDLQWPNDLNCSQG